MYKKNPKRQLKDKTNLNSITKYSGLVFQMFVIILAGTFAGIELDKWLHLGFPVFTLILTLFAVVVAIYFTIKDFIHF